MPRIEHAANVSPTAHYTGYVWARHGLSHPAFATTEGRLLHAAAAPALALSRSLGGPTLDGLLLSRHRVIDALLSAAIESGEVSQVIEIAAGLSPRGWRYARRHGDNLHYIEADLPGMAARKRDLIAQTGDSLRGHAVLDIDAFADSGPASLEGIAAQLDPARGLAIITEGLVNYFPTEAVTALWARMARVASGFSSGLYLSDLHLAGETRGALASGFTGLLSAFVRGRVHLHFASRAQAEAGLRAAGFAEARLHRPADRAEAGAAGRDPAARIVRVIEARSHR